MAERNISEITPEILSLSSLCQENNNIETELYSQYDVKRGLRDVNGKGVLAGLTHISEIKSSKIVDGKSVPCEGQLYFRGYSIRDLVNGFVSAGRPGFEEAAYLLLFGKLPTKEQLKDFSDLLVSYRTLPTNFVRDVIMKAPSNDEYTVKKCTDIICLR